MSTDATKTPGAEALRDGRILVVGGAGFVGSNLVRTLLELRPHHVTVVDNLLSSEAENLPTERLRLEFVRGSITDDRLLAAIDPRTTHVFHLATYHGNQSSIYDPLADHENNALTTLKLYERLKALSGLQSVVYAGAGCATAEKTFEGAKATTEESPPSLFHDSPYSISKLIGELYSNYYFSRHGLPVVRARFQNVYGPREVLGAGRWRGTPATVWRNVVPTFVYRALHRLPLRVDNGGIATRDFIHVGDVVRGLLASATRGRAGEAYNIATGAETSILELAHLVNELTGNPTALDFAPPRSWDRSGMRYGSTEKAQHELSFQAEIGLRSGLADTIAWTRANLPFIESCIRRHDSDMAAWAA